MLPLLRHAADAAMLIFLIFRHADAFHFHDAMPCCFRYAAQRLLDAYYIDYRRCQSGLQEA